jgi:transcriptional regulator with XRE-family HTH domain
MAQFDETKVDLFLGVVRKYMQVRGSLTQKDLSELVGVGVSTMSRFLNQRTTDLNPQLIAKIVAKLNIPLHEMIDFVEEGFSDHFIRLVKLYKDEGSAVGEPASSISAPIPSGGDDEDDEFADALNGDEGTAQKSTSAKIKVGGKSHTVSFNQAGQGKTGDSEIKDKLRSLSARQKGFLTDFLSLDTDGKDLVVDIGKNIITYLRQKGIDF